jgi:hypothetical protein
VAGDLQCLHGWRYVDPSFSGLCYNLLPLLPGVGKAVTLGTRMVEMSLGWETHDVEYVPFSCGYPSWRIEILKNHSLHLMGQEDCTDFIYGAIYCSWRLFHLLHFS